MQTPSGFLRKESLGRNPSFFWEKGFSKKIRGSLLAEEAVKAALDDYHAKQGKAE